MKKITVLLLVLFTMLTARVDPRATQLKTEYPKQYEYVKDQAVIKWGSKYDMISYTINNQAKDFYFMMYHYEGNSSDLFFSSIEKWSLDLKHNVKMMKEDKSNSIKVIAKFKCNWRMAKYEYEKQLKAKKDLGF